MVARELGWATEVVRNDAIDLNWIAARRPSHIGSRSAAE